MDQRVRWSMLAHGSRLPGLLLRMCGLAFQVFGVVWHSLSELWSGDRQNCCYNAVMLPLERFHHLVSALLADGEAGFSRQTLLSKLDVEAMIAACQALANLLPNVDGLVLLGLKEPVMCLALANTINCPFVMVGDLDLVMNADEDATPEFADRADLLQLAFRQRTLAIDRTAIPIGAEVIVFDELLEVGAESLALVHLAQKAGAKVLAVAALTEKTHLGARSRLQIQGVPVISLVQVAKHGGQLILEQRSNQHS